MRILQVSSARHFGGGERHFVDLARGLVEKGHELFIAVAEDSPLLPGLRQITGDNILRLPFRRPFDIATAWKLRKFTRARGVEIIHAHMARDYPLAALAASTSATPRLVLTRHVLFPMGKLHRLTRRRVARVIAVSEAVAAGLRNQRIFGDEQITVVHHGIDLEKFRDISRRAEKDRMRVGILGELSPVKGQTEFVLAASIIATQRDDVEFVIAGRDHSADGAYVRQLKQLIVRKKLDSRVELIESHVEVADFLWGLDVFVSASTSEAFGLAIVDAMAAGLPVVATATGGASEIIVDGETGLLTPIGSCNELADRIIQLLDDGERRKRLATNARQMVAERFALPRMISETEDVYRSVLSR
jgi:glycosyltransferase involved in cell wall biosynthesis